MVSSYCGSPNWICVKGSKCPLTYDLVSIGSLNKYIFLGRENSISLGLQMLYKIALGVARGIEYLHHGYDEQIIWFNIKAYNILPHEDFTPKVLNFYQMKLCLIDKIIVSHCITRNTGIYQSISILQKHWGHLL